jgi:hypothetical protein
MGLPRVAIATARVPIAGGVPTAPVAGAYGAVAVLGFMALIFPFDGAERPAFAHGLWVLLPMAASTAIRLGSVRLVGRWEPSRRLGRP